MSLALVINAGQVERVGATTSPEKLEIRAGATAGLDTDVAGILAIGGSSPNATSIEIGVDGVGGLPITLGEGGAGGSMTTVGGDLTVSGNEIVVGSTTFQGNTQIGDNIADTLEVQATLINSTAAGTPSANTTLLLEATDNHLIIVAAAAAATTGGALGIQAGEGGVGTGANGATGGAISVTGGIGGDGDGTDDGGVGGAGTVVAGAGGAATGAGNRGGAGGALTISAGGGGNSAAFGGGPGGALTLSGGDGGTGTFEGDGGDVVVAAGDSLSSNGNGGNIDINPGTGVSTDGVITMLSDTGLTNGTSMTIGNTTVYPQVNIVGRLDINNNAATGGIPLDVTNGANGNNPAIRVTHSPTSATASAESGIRVTSTVAGTTADPRYPILMDQATRAEGGVNYGEMIQMRTTGTGADEVSILVGDGDPNGNVTEGEVGSFFIDAVGATAYIKTAAPSTWAAFATGSGAAETLQQTYDAGRTIVVGSVTETQPVSISNPNNANGNLTLSQTFAGGGNALGVTMGASSTGNALDVTMTAGASGEAINITDGTDTTRLNVGSLSASQTLTIDTDNNATATATGFTINVLPGDGGAASGGTDGGNGGAFIATAGDGGAGGAGAGETGGNGGLASLTGGLGGAGGGVGGGNGGGISISGGLGAVADATSAGVGGTVTLTGGTGGAAVGAVAGALGGPATLTAGPGGAGSASAVGGGGGTMTIRGGTGGADGGAGGAAGGDLSLNGGAGTGAAADGGIFIGSASGSAVSVGGAGNGLTASFFGAETTPSISHAEPILLDTNVGTVEAMGVFVADGSPDSVISAQAGSLCLVDTGAVYVNTSAGVGTTWSQLTAGGGNSLQQAYVAGNTIAVTSGEGTIDFSNSADVTDVLTIGRTFAGTGDGIQVNMGASTTGNAIRIASSATAAAANSGGLFVDMGGGSGVGVHVQRSVAAGSGESLVEISNATSGGGDALTVAQTGTTSGNAVDVLIGATATGNALDVTMTSGATGEALSITDGTDTTRLNLADLRMSAAFTIATDDNAAATAGAAGFSITTQLGAGQDNTAGAGGAGGGTSVNGGGGGDGSGANLGGAGGSNSLIGGTGGQSVTGQSGTGGAINLVGGTGGQIASGGSFGGFGGAVSLTGGVGGAASTGAGPAGAGGSGAVTGGAGGAGTATGAAGAGGALTITGGAAGSDGGAGGASGGGITIRGGLGSNGTDGNVTIGDLNTENITIGQDALPGSVAVLSGGTSDISFDARGITTPLTVNDATDVNLNGGFGSIASIIGALNALITGSVATPATFQGTTAEAIAQGAPVAFNTTNGLVEGDANSGDTREQAFGLARVGVGSAATLQVVLAGEVTVPDAQWDSAPTTGDSGKIVYLSNTVGNLTLTAPTAGGSRVLKMGLVSFADGSANTTRVMVGVPDSVKL